MRILTLDGGGGWAILQAQALIDMFPQAQTGHDVLRQFDFAAANSGGTIVLAGLIENLPLAQIRDFFLDEAARQVFSLLPWWKRIMRIIDLGPRYDAEAKLPALAARMPVTGGQQITALPAHVSASTGRPFHFLLMTFDYDRRRAVFQRSDSASAAASAAAASVPTLAQAVHAATNAPVNYFDEPAKFSLFDGHLPVPGPRRRRFWDGAIGGYNNPALAAAVEVLTRPGAPAPADIGILSIGTGTVTLPLDLHYPSAPGMLVSKLPKQSLLHDIRTVATAILDDPPDAASFIAHVWLGGRMPSAGMPVSDGPIVRLNPLVQPLRDQQGNLSLPPGLSAQQFVKLCEMDMDAVVQDEVELVRRLGELWLADSVPNQPVRANGVTLAAEIGFARYTPARQAWLARHPWR